MKQLLMIYVKWSLSSRCCKGILMVHSVVGSGPSFNTLQIRRKAREALTCSMIFEGESDCSPPRKRKKFTKKKCTKENRVKSNKKVSTNKWQISDGSDQSERCDSNEETPNLSTIRLGNKHGRRSADFLTSLKTSRMIRRR